MQWFRLQDGPNPSKASEVLSMATKQLLLPSPLVKMDNALARAQWPDGGQYDLDLVMHIASKIRVDDEDFHTYTFPVSELGYGERLDGRTYKRVKDALERLSKGSIKVEGERKNFYFYSLFSMAGYEDGKIVVRFDPQLKPFFLHLSKNFTSFELFEMRMLPSEYSKRLFILLKSYASMDECIVNINDLHEKLLTPESVKQDFAQFRLRILNKAQKDLLGTLLFEWEPIKKGRAVIQIRFIFNKAKVFAKRKALEAAEKEKAQKKLNETFVEAVKCAKEKVALEGTCTKATNKRKVCTQCRQMNLVEDAISSAKNPNKLTVNRLKKP